jgi:hypothetical protein
MSQYTFRIWFTGLMHFVENKDPYAKCQLCVVLPRADQDYPRHRRHVGAIYEVTREPFCGKLRLQPGSTIYQPLDRHRVAFRITRTDDIQPEPSASQTFPYGYLHMQDIAGIFADENDQIVSLCPPPTVLAQILVQGEYSFGYEYGISTVRDWTIPQTLTGFGSFELPLADPVYVDIPNVEKVEILFYSIDEGERVIYSEVLRPGSNGFIEIMAANSCRVRENEHCLLHWEDLDFQWRGGNHLIILQIDNDFEYHYRLLHPSTLEAIKKVLPKKHEELPDQPRYPVPESPLVEIEVAPHICLEDFFKPRPSPMPEPHEGEHRRQVSIEDWAVQIVKRWCPEGTELFKLLVQLLITILGTGTGSGNDCLGTKAQARFVGLDDFIPAPQPAVSMSVLHARTALDRRVCFPYPGDPGYPFSKKPEEKSADDIA